MTRPRKNPGGASGIRTRPGPSALEADALTTRPTRRSGKQGFDPGSAALETDSLATQPTRNRLVGLVVKASASRAEDPGIESRLRRDFFRGRVIPVT